MRSNGDKGVTSCDLRMGKIGVHAAM